MAFLGAIGKFIGKNVGSILGVGSNVASTVSNYKQQQKLNDRSERFTRQMFDAQGQRELEYFNLQNAYNDPSAQMQRLKDAGLNPNLVYGNGATTESASISPKQAHQPNFQAPRLDLGNVVQQALLTQQSQANIRRTDAETEAIKVNSESGRFDLKVKEAVGLDSAVRTLDSRLTKESNNNIKEIREFESWLQAAGAGSPLSVNSDRFGTKTDDPNSLISIAQKAGIQETIARLETLKKEISLRGQQETLNSIEIELKDFRKRLSDYGVNDTTIKGLSVLVSIIQQIFGK